MEILSVLQAADIFCGLSIRALSRIAASFDLTEIREKQLLARTGKEVEHIGLVLVGEAELRIRDKAGDAVPFYVLNRGEFFGEMAVLENGCALYDIEAVTPMTLLLQTRRAFLNNLNGHPTVIRNAYRLNVERLTKLCLALLKHEQSELADSLFPEQSRYITNAMSYIDHNFTEQFTLDEIARRNNVSKYHFARRFKAATGYSFKDYLNRRRVREAKALMRKNGLNIAEVCYAVGFNDLSYFGRVFKRLEGITPSDYRKQLRFS